jgi:hypothetical protein
MGARPAAYRRAWRIRAWDARRTSATHTLHGDAYGDRDSRHVSSAHDDRLRWMTGDPDFDPSVWPLAERDGPEATWAWNL